MSSIVNRKTKNLNYNKIIEMIITGTKISFKSQNEIVGNSGQKRDD